MIRHSAKLATAAALAAGCGASELHIQGAPSSSTYVESFDHRPTSAALGAMRLRPDVCTAIDLRPVGRPLEAEDFAAFARTQGLDARIVRARADLVFVDIVNGGTSAPVRFRVAVLDTPGAAARELHVALLQHGGGTWGLQRGNLAVLAPIATVDDAVTFAAKWRLACWGVLMIAGLDDTYVVPGGYAEL